MWWYHTRILRGRVLLWSHFFIDLCNTHHAPVSNCDNFFFLQKYHGKFIFQLGRVLFRYNTVIHISIHKDKYSTPYILPKFDKIGIFNSNAERFG